LAHFTAAEPKSSLETNKKKTDCSFAISVHS